MKLILFDIDGTLLSPDGAGRLALERALVEVCGRAGPVDSLPMAGKTDWQIVAELLAAAGFEAAAAEAHLPACFEAVGRHMARAILERRVRACPGVPALLDRLGAHPHTLLGLLTGNLPATAPLKLRAAGLDPALFRVGAYGTDGRERSLLPAVALARARALTGRPIPGADAVIVGDTPADVTCGRHLGMRAVGVGTGGYTPEALAAAGADRVFPDLADTEAVLRAIF
jgi:phosphoglycolate phosphatase-like HAD superfamily hydrolase